VDGGLGVDVGDGMGMGVVRCIHKNLESNSVKLTCWLPYPSA